MVEYTVPVRNAGNQDTQMPDRVVERDSVSFLVEENAAGVEHATNHQPSLDRSASDGEERISTNE